MICVTKHVATQQHAETTLYKRNHTCQSKRRFFPFPSDPFRRPAPLFRFAPSAPATATADAPPSPAADTPSPPRFPPAPPTSLSLSLSSFSSSSLSSSLSSSELSSFPPPSSMPSTPTPSPPDCSRGPWGGFRPFSRPWRDESVRSFVTRITSRALIYSNRGGVGAGWGEGHSDCGGMF